MTWTVSRDVFARAIARWKTGDDPHDTNLLIEELQRAVEAELARGRPAPEPRSFREPRPPLS